MSPRVASATALPSQTFRKSNPLSRMVAEALDNLLLHYAHTQTPFTVTELRDQLQKMPDLMDVDSALLRYRVRDRLQTLERHELIEQVALLGKRRKVFRLLIDDGPTDAADTADAADDHEAAIAGSASHLASPTPSHASHVDPLSGPYGSESPSDTPSKPVDSDHDLHAHLSQESQTLRLHMEAAMGESEHLRQLLSQFPQAAQHITPLLEAATAKGSRLKGRLDANIALKQILSNPADSNSANGGASA